MTADRIRTITIVTIVTLLVWLFAESRTLRSETITVPIGIEPGSRALVYRVLGESWDGIVELEITGPTAQIDELRSQAIEAGITLELGNELPGDVGVRLIDLRNAIRQDQAFVNTGIILNRVTPEALQIEIDRVQQVTIPVTLDLAGIETVGVPVVRPHEITIGLPASLAEGLNATAVARIDSSRLAEITPGAPVEIRQVPIRSLGVPEDTWGLTFDEPRLVSVTLQLPAVTRSTTLPEMPVYLSLTPADHAAWIVEIPPEDRVLTGITATGPASQIDSIRRGDVRLSASVRISSDDLARGIEAAPIRILNLPQGVVTDLGDRMARIRATRRQPEQGSPERP